MLPRPFEFPMTIHCDGCPSSTRPPNVSLACFNAFHILSTHRFKPANIVVTVRKDMNINFVRHSWFTRWSVTSTQNWGSYKKEQKKKKDGIVFEDRHQTNCWSWGGEWNKSSAKLIRSSSPGKIGLTRDTIAKSFMRLGYIDVIQTVHFPLNSPHINCFACCTLAINVRYRNWFSINHDEPFWRGSRAI